MKIALDSNQFPSATRIADWRRAICDTYVGLDCRFGSDNFRATVEGHAVCDHKITRVATTSTYEVERSHTLIKRDDAEVVLVGFVLAGRIEIAQGA